MTWKIINTKTNAVVAVGLSLNEASYYIRTCGFRAVMLPYLF